MSTADCLENTTTIGLVFNNSTLSTSSDEGTNHFLVFCSMVIVIGLFGSLMNGVVLSILLSKKLRSKPSYLLIIHQVVLDFLSCMFLLPCYVIKIRTVYMVGDWGKFVCNVLYSDNGLYSLQAGSIANLVLIATERYLKIVHVVFHRTYFRRWMSYAGLVFIWVIVVFINIPYVWTTEVIDGLCYASYYWPSESAYLAFGGFVIVWEFVIPLILFVYFYGHILLFVRLRNRAINGNYTNQAMATSLQTNAQRSQMNVTITMIIVSSAFVLCWLPNQLFYLYIVTNSANGLDAVYYTTIFLVFFNVCMNPLIYAAKHEEVKSHLKKWFFNAKVHQEASTVVDTISETVPIHPHLYERVSLTGITHA